jgi:hypothetical protein
VLGVVELFRERDTVDELGVGVVRDTFSDLLFPGTSTLHSRGRLLALHSVDLPSDRAFAEPPPPERSCTTERPTRGLNFGHANPPAGFGAGEDEVGKGHLHPSHASRPACLSCSPRRPGLVVSRPFKHAREGKVAAWQGSGRTATRARPGGPSSSRGSFTPLLPSAFAPPHAVVEGAEAKVGSICVRPPLCSQ